MLDSQLSSRLQVPLPDPYVYKSVLKRGLAGILDAAGDLLLAPPSTPLDWNAVRRVAVLRLDHLGDVLGSFPALAKLRSKLPKAQIDLFVGPWGEELARMSPSVDSVQVVQASWFRRPTRVEWPWSEIGALGARLRQGNYDLGIELRGDLRHHLALALSGTPLRLGHAVTAGRFLLTHPGRYKPGLHEIDQNLALLGIVPGARVRLKPPAAGRAEAAQVMKRLGLGRGFVALQAACGTPAKRWMPERWAGLIRGLKGRKIVLLGSKAERREMLAIAARCGPTKPAVASGMLGLSGLAALLKQARLLISVDSGPAHLAAALGTPVLGLYSGTNRVEQWGVRGAKVRILRAEVPCSPCELTVCPYGNECMRRIGLAEVLAAAKAML